MSEETKVPGPGEEKCTRCGFVYKAGAPHAMFCRGNVPPESKCASCGMDDAQDMLSECRECGEIVCECCKEDGTHMC